MLEIGCGWGSFALAAAGEFGARVTGLTISEQQAALARERVEAAGLAHRVEIRLQDYRTLDGTFTAIASIEMLEAIGHAQYPGVLRRVRPAPRARRTCVHPDDRDPRPVATSATGGTTTGSGGTSSPARCCRRSRAVAEGDDARFAPAGSSGSRRSEPHYAPTLQSVAPALPGPARRRAAGWATTSASCGRGTFTSPTARRRQVAGAARRPARPGAAVRMRIWITGASTGIGAATARELARRGHTLFLTARSATSSPSCRGRRSPATSPTARRFTGSPPRSRRSTSPC